MYLVSPILPFVNQCGGNAWGIIYLCMTVNFQTSLKYKLHHLLFWVVYYVFWILVYRSLYESLGTLMQVTILYLIGHAGIYYTTQLLLLPLLLHKYNLAAFIAGFLMSSLFFATIMYLGMGFVFTAQELQKFQPSPTAMLVYLWTSNIFVGGLLVGGKAMVENLRNRRLNENIKREQLESELHYLKAQVNPHFLFNTINSVYVLIKMDPDKAAHTLIKLSELLRSQLYEFGDKEISMEQELLYLHNYIELEKIRKGENVKVEFNQKGNLSEIRIAPLVLIPFLENCFKFVSSGKQSENLVKIILGYEQGYFTAHFYNTKDPQQQQAAVGGIGLKNITRRLELIYPNSHELEIKDLEKEYIVNLKIRLNGR